MIVCQFQLADVNEGDGGLCVIPGSHKANFPCPEEILVYQQNQELVYNVPCKAGDLVIFNEATIHGTLPWTAAHQRRSLLYRYSPKYLHFAGGVYETSQPEWVRELTEAQQDVIVGTKVRPQPPQFDDIPAAITESVEDSLKRLQMERIPLVQLHNRIHRERPGGDDGLGLADLDGVVSAFQQLQKAGKIAHWGITGLGETEALHQFVETGEMGTIQCCYNLLNRSAGQPVADEFPFQNYAQLIDQAANNNLGVIAIRVLAAGALTGTGERHPYASQTTAPISSGATFQEDLAQSERFTYLVRERVVETLAEAAIRFAISKPQVSTALVGLSNLEQLQTAVHAAEKGPLPEEILHQLADQKG